MATWNNLEDRVREIAAHIYGYSCKAERVAGVDIDAVVRIDREIVILIEVTERRDLQKTRDDVIKLQTAKTALLAQGILARCFCVVNGSVTDGMVEAGKPHNINVLSLDDFTKQFFDFDRYRTAREAAAFGSAVNPLTGKKDDTQYVSVTYRVDGAKADISSSKIAEYLKAGRKIILLGEYGSGKSRCIKEVFSEIAKTSSSDMMFPVAIDLRESWGLRRSSELLRRHFTDLGLDSIQSNAVRAMGAGSLVVMLDGFDEIGSQAWSNDDQKLRGIRAQALAGVKDLVSKSNDQGILITGREHYFPSNEEMFSALGLDARHATVIRCKDEFSDEELEEYFNERGIDVDIPAWLPRRPLICQTISDLPAEDLERMFGAEGQEVAFWDHFMNVLCVRDARINAAFDAKSIFQVLVHLARITRVKSANVGPISLADAQKAFEAAVGQMPVEEASVMLQRLPSLGRLSAESNDRQFIDTYILDGLRGRDVAALAKGREDERAIVLSSSWINPLDDLGQRILADSTQLSRTELLEFAKRACGSKNSVLAADMIASLARGDGDAVDFGGSKLIGGEFLRLDLSSRSVKNLTIADSVIISLVLPKSQQSQITIENTLAERVYGVASHNGLPAWARNLKAEHFDSVENVARIRRIGLEPGQEILVAIIRKTFFQKGAGRKEEALVRGLGKIAAPGVRDKVLNMLLRENLLEKFKGNEGWVYAPVRAHAGRMKRMMDELKLSTDEIWIEAGKL